MHPGPASRGSQGGAQTWCEEQKKVWTWWGCREVSGPPVDKDIIQPDLSSGEAWGPQGTKGRSSHCDTTAPSFQSCSCLGAGRQSRRKEEGLRAAGEGDGPWLRVRQGAPSLLQG